MVLSSLMIISVKLFKGERFKKLLGILILVPIKIFNPFIFQIFSNRRTKFTSFYFTNSHGIELIEEFSFRVHGINHLYPVPGVYAGNIASTWKLPRNAQELAKG